MQHESGGPHPSVVQAVRSTVQPPQPSTDNNKDIDHACAAEQPCGSIQEGDGALRPSAAALATPFAAALLSVPPAAATPPCRLRA